MKSTNETSDLSVIYRYKKAHNPEELDGTVKMCPHCNGAKIYRSGRMWTSCPICRNASPYPKQIRIK